MPTTLSTAPTTRRIRRLDPVVINKIAAGEVVERPANVVKELLENAVDALATRIECHVVKGGMESIRIVDDGGGIEPDDLPLAVASHATSKLQTAEDLFRVHTMGFRGEALASIASISETRIRSRVPGCDGGWEIVCDRGEVGEVQPCGCPTGTVVEVRRLFSSTPVRRRFLKTTGTEFGHVSDWFTRLAIAHPRLHLVLSHDGKVVHELPATDRLLDRIAMLHGKSLAGKLLWIESEADGVRLSGYVAHPEEHRSNRKGQHLFLNGRWIQDRSLQHALGEAYRGLLMVGRHPIAYLHLDVPAELVDVNVHPTKTEVRFVDGQRMYRQLLSTLRTRFLQLDFDAPAQRAADEGEPSPPPDPERQRQLQAEFADWAKTSLADWQPPAGPVEGRVIEPTTLLSGLEAEPRPTPETVDPSFKPNVESTLATERAHALVDGRRVMQILDTYLVLETDEGLTLIDQHALHERIMYETLRERVLAGRVESQRLLVPIVLEVTGREREVLFDHGDLVRSLGFEVEDFGGGDVAISGYPVMLAKADLEEVLRDLIDGLDVPGNQPDRRDLLDSLLHMMSCKAAIKAGHRLSPEEMDTLLRQRHLVQDSHHCPHGRPTALTLTRDELDRRFGRLG